MPSFPLWYLLVPFGGIVLASALFFFFNIFHIRRYGIRSGGTLLLMLVYVVTYIGLLAGIGLVLSMYNWQEEITAQDLLPEFGEGFDLEV